MMQGVQTFGSADSGFGVTLAGFHCPNIEFAARMEVCEKAFGPFMDFAKCEENGFVTFVGYRRDALGLSGTTLLATYRREPHKFFTDLQKFLSSTKATGIERLSLSCSLGSVSLTILLRHAQEETHV